jgi:hypothetical protein
MKTKTKTHKLVKSKSKPDIDAADGKWIESATKHKGRLRKYLTKHYGLKPDQKITNKLLNQARSETKDPTVLHEINLAKTLKKMNKPADTSKPKETKSASTAYAAEDDVTDNDEDTDTAEPEFFVLKGVAPRLKNGEKGTKLQYLVRYFQRDSKKPVPALRWASSESNNDLQFVWYNPHTQKAVTFPVDTGVHVKSFGAKTEILERAMFEGTKKVKRPSEATSWVDGGGIQAISKKLTLAGVKHVLVLAGTESV